MIDMSEIKCDACPRVCPEEYQKMVAKASRACQERDTANGLLRREMDRHRWIPVTEQMPDPRDADYVIVCATEKHDGIDYQNTVTMAVVYNEWLVDAEIGCVLVGVTHWMPLPNAPEVPHA